MMGAESKGRCEHIEGNRVLFTDGKITAKIEGVINFCPICGSPRPEKEKGLADKFEKMQTDGSLVSYEGHEEILKNWCKRLSQTAIDHAIEILETKIDHISDGKRSFVYVDKLKQALRESL